MLEAQYSFQMLIWLCSKNMKANGKSSRVLVQQQNKFPKMNMTKSCVIISQHEYFCKIFINHSLTPTISGKPIPSPIPSLPSLIPLETEQFDSLCESGDPEAAFEADRARRAQAKTRYMSASSSFSSSKGDEAWGNEGGGGTKRRRQSSGSASAAAAAGSAESSKAGLTMDAIIAMKRVCICMLGREDCESLLCPHPIRRLPGVVCGVYEVCCAEGGDLKVG